MAKLPVSWNQEVEEDRPMGGDEAVVEKKVILGKYELGRLLGRGTFAKVYLARDVRSGEAVAIKIIDKCTARRRAGNGALEQIQREVSAMRLARHPHVVELREVMASRTSVYVVMEYVRGGELFSRLARGRLPEDTARRCFLQLLSAVEFCHAHGVAHRDLKPENLLVDERGNVKVSDFGLSALPEQLQQDGLLHTRCGTPAYVAPEVLRRRGYDGARADLWSCGVILYVLLVGRLPFYHENILYMYQKIFKAEYQVPHWVSGEAKRLIGRLLVVDPAKRMGIPEIMESPWFKKGYEQLPPAILLPPKKSGIIEENEPAAESPRACTAFELISAMSTGLNLSGLFESQRPPSTVFTSRAPASSVVEKLSCAAKALGFAVVSAKAYKLRMEGPLNGRLSRLTVTATVSELVAKVALVEFELEAGCVLEFAEFCSGGMRAALKDIVWAWQGGDDGAARE